MCERKKTKTAEAVFILYTGKTCVIQRQGKACVRVGWGWFGAEHLTRICTAKIKKKYPPTIRLRSLGILFYWQISLFYRQ